VKGPPFFLVSGEGEGEEIKAKSSQVLDMYPKEFPIAPHFYPISFGKCCSLFTNIGGPRGRNSMIQNRTFYLGEPP